LSSLTLIRGFVAKIDLCIASKPYSTECLIAANNDLQAVHSWLMQYAHKNTTFLTYKRESQRLLLWCSHEAGKTLGELKTEDFTQYILFLSNPPKNWCSVTKSRVRPFVGPLSDSARITAIRVINSLMNYLVAAQYLRANPLALIKQHSKFNISTTEYKYTVWSKILDDTEWQALQQTLQEMPEDTPYERDNKIRTQFIFACLYLLGLRISELANSTWNAFKFHQDAWWFFVRGKGDKLGHIPVNGQLLDFIKNYRGYLGKNALPVESDTQHLLVSKKTGRPLSLKQIYCLIKAIGAQTATKFESSTISYKKLMALSPHSLRHLSASHQDRAGISMSMIQENLRHASMNTTKIYLHADDLARSGAMDKINMSLKAADIKHFLQDPTLTISLAGGNVCTKYSLEKLLYIIENKIFNMVKWIRVNGKLDLILREYHQANNFGLEYKIRYIISDCDDVNLLSEFIASIEREADIRLLKATVVINSGSNYL
jgi:site-specific recombinase XerD